MLATVRQARPEYLLLSLGCVAVNMIGKAVRWKILMHTPGANIKTQKIFLVLTVGQMLNWVYPARAGDLARAYLLGNSSIERSYMLGTVLLEKLIDILAFGFCVLLLVAFMPLPGWALNSVRLFLLVSLIFVITLLLIAQKQQALMAFLQKVSSWLDERFAKSIHVTIIQSIQSGLQSLRLIYNRDLLIKASLWTLVVWGTALFTNQTALLAFRIALPLTTPLLLLILLQIGITLPSIPTRIGLFEYICILALAVFGISQPLALSYGLVLHGMVMLPIVFIGVIFSWRLGLPSRRQTSDLDTGDQEQSFR